MVFHRFLAGEAPGPPLAIRVRETMLAPWDPFARAEPLTRAFSSQAIPLEHAGSRHEVIVQPFVLPLSTIFQIPRPMRRPAVHIGGTDSRVSTSIVAID